MNLTLLCIILDFGLGLDGPMGGPGGMLGGGPPVSSTQPLPSNMVPKSGSGMDQQYLQQSSQIFVFSTQWANKVIV